MNTSLPRTFTWLLSWRFALPFVLFFLCFCKKTAAQAPQVRWEKTYGGDSWDELNMVLPQADGLVFGGTSQSSGWTFPANGTFYPDFSLFKLDMEGNLLWKRAFGGILEERPWALVQTLDGGFLMGGASNSDTSGNKTTRYRGDFDYWIVRTDAEGNKLWDKSYGGAYKDELYAILPCSNGDFLLFGLSNSPISGEKTDSCRGSHDLWVLRIDSVGNVLWDKTIGGNFDDRISSNRSAIFAPDGTVLIAGMTSSLPSTGEISSQNIFPDMGSSDFWLLNLNPADGTLLWNKRYGGIGVDIAYTLHLAADNQSLYIGGESNSPGNVISMNPCVKRAEFRGGLRDFWLIKTDLQGNKYPNFDYTFGGSGDDGLYDLSENYFGDLNLIGYSDSPGSEAMGNYDWYMVCMDQMGREKYALRMGGSDSDSPTKITRLGDGSMVIIGHNRSDANLYKSTPNLGVNDFWIVRTLCDVEAEIMPLPFQDPCSGEPIALQVQSQGCDSCVYIWSHGVYGSDLELPPGTSDTFSVLVLDKNACLASDGDFFEVFEPIDFSLNIRDTTIIENQSITIGGNNPEIQYLWSSGDTSASITVAHSGVFLVTVTDEHGCTATSWARVQATKKDAVYIPNAFSPDFDGKNDYFSIFADASVRRILKFQIYDRWGDLLFSMDNFSPNYESDGWDGKFRGREMMPGVYKYFAIVEYIDGGKEIFQGTVALIR